MHYALPHNKLSGCGFPVSNFIHLFNNNPPINYYPAIENIKKKNIKTAIVCISIGIDDVNDIKITFNFFDFDMVFKGRRILKDLILYNEPLDPFSSLGNQLETTIIKSNIFQLSFK